MSVSAQKNRPLRPGERGATAGAFHIEDVYPSLEGGRFPVKRMAGEAFEVWADIYRGGHDVLAAQLIWRKENAKDWQRTPMRLHDNDRWRGAFTPPEAGRYVYAIEAWTDEFATWKHGFTLKQRAGQDVGLDGLEGAALLTHARFSDKDAAAVIVRQCDRF